MEVDRRNQGAISRFYLPFHSQVSADFIYHCQQAFNNFTIWLRSISAQWLVLAGTFLIKFHSVTVKLGVAHLRFYIPVWVEYNRLVVRTVTWGVEQWISVSFTAYVDPAPEEIICLKLARSSSREWSYVHPVSTQLYIFSQSYSSKNQANGFCVPL